MSGKASDPPNKVEHVAGYFPMFSSLMAFYVSKPNLDSILIVKFCDILGAYYSK